MENDFLKSHQETSAVLGFWNEEYRSVIIKIIERGFKKDVIQYHQLSDVVIQGDKALLRWSRRVLPLTEDQLKNDYGY